MKSTNSASALERFAVWMEPTSPPNCTEPAATLWSLRHELLLCSASGLAKVELGVVWEPAPFHLGFRDLRTDFSLLIRICITTTVSLRTEIAKLGWVPML